MAPGLGSRAAPTSTGSAALLDADHDDRGVPWNRGTAQDATGDGKDAVADAEVPQKESAERTLALPDLEHAKSAVVNSLTLTS
jgi:hypothetical protein